MPPAPLLKIPLLSLLSLLIISASATSFQLQKDKPLLAQNSPSPPPSPWQSLYIIPLILNGKQYSPRVSLDHGPSWLKADECVVCEDGDCESGEECGHGVDCVRSQCRKLNKKGEMFGEFGRYGRLVQLQVNIDTLKQDKQTQFSYKPVLLTKMNKYIDDDGVLSLTNGDLDLGGKILLVKNNNPNITVYLDSDWKQANLLQEHNEVSPNPLTISLDESITGIRIRQLFKQVQANLKTSAKGASPNQHILPLKPHSLTLSLSTSSLLVPQKSFQKFCSLLKDAYFPSCTIGPSKQEPLSTASIACPSPQQLNLQKLNNVTLTLQTTKSQIQFPFRALVQNCRDGSCVLGVGKLAQGKGNNREIVVGDFLLNLFGVEFENGDDSGRVRLHRLKNQWSQNFQKQRKYSPHQTNFMFMFIRFIFLALMFVFKLLFWLAIIALAMNCIVRRKQVLEYILDILSKLTNKQLREQLKQEKLEALEKWSSKIKQKLKKKLKSPHIYIPDESHTNLDQQQHEELTSKKHDNTRTTTVMSLQDLSDPSQDEREETTGQRQGSMLGRLRDKKQEIQSVLEEAKKVLLQKMESKKEIPQILKNMPTQIKKIVTHNFQKLGEFAEGVNKQEQNKQGEEVKKMETAFMDVIEGDKQETFYDFDSNDYGLSFEDQ